MLKRLVSLCLSVGMLMTSCLIGQLSITVSAEEIRGENGFVSYTFTGDDAEKEGYAEGTVILSGGTKNYYVLYWANDDGVLEGCYPISSVSKNVGKYSFKRKIAIPAGATKLAVFSDADGKVADTALANALDIVEIPDKKQIKQKEYFSFASISDVHVNDTNYGGPEKLTAGLNWFDELGLDKVIVSGDVSLNATTEEMTTYTDSVLKSNFDIMDIYEARGNHESQNNDNFLYYTSGGIGDWTADNEVRPFDDSPYFYVLFEGSEGEFDNLFIFMALEITSTDNTAKQDPFSAEQLDWVEDVIKQYAGTDTNIFLVEHAPFYNWGSGDIYNGKYPQNIQIKNKYPQAIRFRELLSEYKELITMSGHTHVKFEDDVNFSDENGTAARMMHNSSLCAVRGYYNGSLDYSNDGSTTKEYGSQAYAVRVYSDYIIYEAANVSEKMFYPEFFYILESYSEKRSGVADIEITSLPKKTSYEVGEWIVPEGLEVTAIYENGTSKVVDGWLLEPQGVLTVRDDKITVRYGNITKAVDIDIVNPFYGFAGNGTYEDPYLIQNEEDFYKFTENMKKWMGADSSTQDDVYGYELFFKQTKDLDMTGYTGYSGINANGNQKFGFSGVYDGCGHSITVNINDLSNEKSIFPYVNGIIMNVSFEGKIQGKTAQPIRTIGSYGLVVNCKSSLTLSGDSGRGLTQTMYGTVCRYYFNGKITANVKNPIVSTDNNGTYLSAYYNCGDSSEYGIEMWDNDVMYQEFNNANDSALMFTVGIMKRFNKNLADSNLVSWKIYGNDIVLDSNSTLSEGSSKNIAPYGTAIDDGRDDYYNLNSTLDCLNDGDLNRGWQYKSHSTSPSYVGVMFDKAETVDSVTLFWESGNKATEYTVQYTTDGNIWKDAAIIKLSISDEIDTAYFEAVKAKGVRIYMTAYESTKFAPRLYELAVFKSYARETPKYKTETQVKNGYIYGLNSGIALSDYKTMTDNAKAVVNPDGGAIKDDEFVSTGCIVKLDGFEYSIVVLGDINGDGKVNSTDFMKVRKNFIGGYEMNSVELSAADVNDDGKVNSTDFMRIRNHFLGKYSLYE